jgi:DNA polymerase III subunit delta
MADSTLSAPLSSIPAFSLGQNFLLVGSDSYLIDTVIGQIKDQLKAKTELDITVVYADEVKNKAGELAEHLDTFTIFSSDKLVIVKNCEQLLKKELEVLSAHFDAPAETQSLIVVVEKFDARLATWKKVVAGSLRINCDPPKWGSEIRNWLMTELRRMGKTMSPKAIEEFSSRIDLDYFSAANELLKLDLLAGDRKSISEADVVASLGTTRPGTKIDFLRALGKKNPKAAIEAVELMLDADWEPLQVFFQIYSFYLAIYKINLLRKKHISDSEISAKHLPDIFFNQRKEYLDFARAYSCTALETIIQILLDTDTKLKSSTIEKNTQLNLAILAILEQK